MLEKRPGTYLLLFAAAEPQICQVGRLGELAIQRGYYCYVGSAFGSGGIQARVNHHSKISMRPHWHLDYVRPAFRLEEIWIVYEEHVEHLWAEQLAANMSIPMAGFGSSDCSCRSHFYYSRHKPDLSGWSQAWAQAINISDQEMTCFVVG